MEQQYQPITMDNLAEVLEFNGFKRDIRSSWDNYFYYNDGGAEATVLWDYSEDTIQLSKYKIVPIPIAMYKSNLDLLLIALERQGIKLKPLFDFKQYLLDSGLFQRNTSDSLTYKCEKHHGNVNAINCLMLDIIEHTKENADRLIEIAKLFKELK